MVRKGSAVRVRCWALVGPTRSVGPYGAAHRGRAIEGTIELPIMSHELPVRRATDADMEVCARLLIDFNSEFDEPAPPAETLAGRLHSLVAVGDTIVLLAGQRPVGIAVLRFRGAIWNPGLECYLAELYVVPAMRRQGVGRALMHAVIDEARGCGAETIEIGVDDPDLAARRLYESTGFTNRTGGPGGALMYVYERDI